MTENMETLPTQPKETLQYSFNFEFNENEIDYWFNVYEEAFRELNEDSPERQTMSHEEFTSAMLDNDISKLAVRNGVGELEGLTIFGPPSKSEVFSWLSQPYFKKHFPEAYEEGRLQYFVTTLTRPDSRNSGVMASMGQLTTDRLVEMNPETIVVFDCCASNEFLPIALHGLATQTAENVGGNISPLVEIGRQNFYAFSIGKD